MAEGFVTRKSVAFVNLKQTINKINSFINGKKKKHKDQGGKYTFASTHVKNIGPIAETVT